MRKPILIMLMSASAMMASCSGGESESGTSDGAAESEATTAAPAQAVTLASLTGNAVAGKAAFAQCRTCHVIDPGVNKIGPSLHQVVGRKAGSVPGYSYSKANAAIGIDWTKENLFQFLEKPQSVIPGTKMIFGGIPDAQKRADIIAYLENPG